MIISLPLCACNNYNCNQLCAFIRTLLYRMSSMVSYYQKQGNVRTLREKLRDESNTSNVNSTSMGLIYSNERIAVINDWKTDTAKYWYITNV